MQLAAEREDYKQALQLSIYKYMLQQDDIYKKQELQPGIWSFAEVSKGISMLDVEDIEDTEIEFAIASLINHILDPEIAFEEVEKIVWNA